MPGSEPTTAAVRTAHEWAVALADAEVSRQPMPPLTGVQRELTLADAYAIQQLNTARREAAGERAVGWKVGLTSLPMQRQLGVDEPDFGAILDTMLIEAGGVVRPSELIAPRVEAEIAVRLGADLGGEAVTVADARAAVADVLLAIEVIDSRIADWRISLPDTVADNASSARVVTGTAIPATPELLASLPGERLEFLVDGEIVAAGLGAEVLGDPLNAVAWLARTLHAFGARLRTGDLILAGAVHASVALPAGAVLRVRSPHLPSLHVNVDVFEGGRPPRS